MELTVQVEKWPISGTFAISRGAKMEARVVVVTLRDGIYEGRGECVPYHRYGETVENVVQRIESVKGHLKGEGTRDKLQKLLPAGAARNALDCALWDLEAKRSGKTIWELAGIEKPEPRPTAFTVSLASPEEMAAAAADASQTYSLLKIKLGGEGDDERLARIRDAAPSARLVVDANEGWTSGKLVEKMKACEEVDVELIEQPLPANNDEALRDLRTSIAICADESAHTSADISRLVGRYSSVNIKLDKTGGLTEALVMASAAREAGLSIMVGCMVSTSLSMAPATVIAQYADYVDLDGPLLLAKDREPAIEYRDGMILPTTPTLWG